MSPAALTRQEIGALGGRPAGRNYTYEQRLMLTSSEEQALRGLARDWGCTVAEAARRCIRRAAGLPDGVAPYRVRRSGDQVTG